MNKTIKQSMKEMLYTRLLEFSYETTKDLSTVEHYAEKFVEDFERYLRAYKEFKED